MSSYSNIVYHIQSAQEFHALLKVLDRHEYGAYYGSITINHIVIMPNSKTYTWYEGKYSGSSVRPCSIMSNFTSTIKMIERCTSV